MTRTSRTRASALVLFIAATLALSACSPISQGAVTLDEATGQPALLLALCPGETVEEVSLSTAVINDNVYSVRRVLWKIRRTGRSSQQRFAVGETPRSFITMQSLLPTRSQWLVLEAQLHGGTAAGAAVVFQTSELEPGVLESPTGATSATALRKQAELNCSDNPLAGLDLPNWSAAVAAAVTVVTAGPTAYRAIRGRRRRVI